MWFRRQLQNNKLNAPMTDAAGRRDGGIVMEYWWEAWRVNKSQMLPRERCMSSCT
jgi:hypothetical protein